MNSLKITISEPQTQQEFKAYFLMRYDLLRKPWHQPLGSERDDLENQCIHVIACDKNKNILGVCRMQFNSPSEAQIRYMGVVQEFQGNGIGKMLLKYLEAKAKQKDVKQIILQARSNAVDFYKKCGYELIEKTYLMWGEIQHYLMAKNV